MNTHNSSQSSSPDSSRRSSPRRASKRGQYQPQLGQKNSDDNALRSLAEAHLVRQPDIKGQLLDKPVLDSPTTLQIRDSHDPTRRPVEVRLWELEGAWAAERSVRWQ